MYKQVCAQIEKSMEGSKQMNYSVPQCGWILAIEHKMKIILKRLDKMCFVTNNVIYLGQK